MHKYLALLIAAGLLTGSSIGHAQERQKPKVAPASVIAAGPDGKLLAVAKERAISIYDTSGQEKKEILRMSGHADTVSALAFAPNGTLLASGGLDKSIRIWSLPTGRLILAIRAGAPIQALSFSVNNQSLIALETDQSQGEYDVATGRLLKKTRAKPKD